MVGTAHDGAGGQPQPARSSGKALVVSASVLPLVPYVPSFTISQQGADFGGAASEVSNSGGLGLAGDKALTCNRDCRVFRSGTNIRLKVHSIAAINDFVCHGAVALRCWSIHQ